MNIYYRNIFVFKALDSLTQSRSNQHLVSGELPINIFIDICWQKVVICFSNNVLGIWHTRSLFSSQLSVVKLEGKFYHREAEVCLLNLKRKNDRDLMEITQPYRRP